jgi:hypothetical protein
MEHRDKKMERRGKRHTKYNEIVYVLGVLKDRC